MGGGSLGPGLEPLIRDACAGRLSPVRWFRSDWQRGGGSTGLATYQSERGPVEVVVKVPVGPSEHRWTTSLGREDDPTAPTPRVLAAGETLGGHDLAWLVIEKLCGLPIGARLDAQGAEDMISALAEWHDRAAAVAPVTGAPAGPDWDGVLARSREVIKRSRLPNAQHWNHEVHQVQRALPTLLRRWNSRPICVWCHGDLHPGNAMRRAPAVGGEVGGAEGSSNGHAARAGRSDSRHLGTCVLIDLALVHPGHWIEDALYFERVYWGRKDLLRGLNLVSTLARARRERGHHDGEDYGMLANVRRVLGAAAAPALLEREGDARYLDNALEVIHRLLPVVGH